MTADVEQLVRETIELTGAEQPRLLDRDAPVLDAGALDAGADDFYIVGLIGGKEVGKSALVNALAGKTITETTAHGPGTEVAIAYVHASQTEALRELLNRIVPDRYRIISHDVNELKRQVLVDLPDIDSQFASHLQVTRALLRHMLYPLWLVSIEKYADRQPQQLLARVADGNAPKNFVFCLNKVDQLGNDTAAATELRDDYARRVQKTLALTETPRVFMVSAKSPDSYELPKLRETLRRQKSADDVRQSKKLAGVRQDRALVRWLEEQQLPTRAQALQQMQDDAEDLAAARIGEPLLETVLPRLMDDPETRGALAEEILTERVAHWPVVRLIHTLLSPVFTLLRGATAKNAAPLQSVDGLVEIAFKETRCSAADLIQSTFAQLRQTRPGVAEFYSQHKLWEPVAAEISAGELRKSLAATLRRQRDAAREKLSTSGTVGAPIRWLLTIGALLWFPFIQPILKHVLSVESSVWKKGAYLVAQVVEVLGVDYLLKSAGFLIIYFVALWLALRWNTQRQVTKLSRTWRDGDAPDPSVNVFAQTIEWLNTLSSPLRDARERMESLSTRAAAVRESLDKAA
jgi:GTPase Era involved in 16S rRNA processing